MILDLEDGSRQAYSYCIDLKSGYTAGAFRVSSTVDNFILDIISFGNGVYFAGYIDGYEIEVFIRDAEAQANNKEAFDIGYRTGSAAAQAGIGIIPGTLGSAKVGEGDSDSKGNGVPVKEKTTASNELDYQSNPKHTPGQPGK